MCVCVCIYIYIYKQEVCLLILKTIGQLFGYLADSSVFLLFSLYYYTIFSGLKTKPPKKSNISKYEEVFLYMTHKKELILHCVVSDYGRDSDVM